MTSFNDAFAEAERLMAQFRADSTAQRALVQAAQRLTESLRTGGKALVCGNGGSMADAMHFAEEWTGRFMADRRPYPVMALSDPTHLTCVGNDYGFEQVFARMVTAFGKPGDLLFVLSTTGRSRNLVLAAEAAKEAGLGVIGFLGRGGGAVAALCDVVVMAPGDRSDRIQEIHMCALHALIEVVERELGHA